MISCQSRTDQAALEVLEGCTKQPPDSELLPLLALSVLATATTFSGSEVGRKAAAIATRLDDAGNCSAADQLVESCAASLQRCGARDAAADLRESLAINRWMKTRNRRGKC